MAGQHATAVNAGSRGRVWLYPLASGEDHASFGRARHTPTDFIGYRHLVTTTSIAVGQGPLVAGSRSMQVGDVLWLSLGPDVGIVGRATVSSVKRHPDPWVTFELDREVSRALARDPLPGAVLRGWGVGPLNRPVQLEGEPTDPEFIERWIDDGNETCRRALESLDALPLRSVDSPLDNPGVAALARVLRAGGFAVGVPNGPSGAAIIACDDSRLIVATTVEARKNAGRRVLEAIGLLGWYARALAENHPTRQLTPHVWFVFRTAPPDDVIEFLETHANLVCWSNGGDGLTLGPETKVRWRDSAIGPATTPSEGALGPQRTRLESGTRALQLQDEPQHDRGMWVTSETTHVISVVPTVAEESSIRLDDTPRQADASVAPRVEDVREQAPAPRGSPSPSPAGRAAMSRCTARAHDALRRARQLAESRGHAQVHTSHLIIVLMDDPTDLLARVLELLGVTPDQVRRACEHDLVDEPIGTAPLVAAGDDLAGSFQNACKEAQQCGVKRVGTHHLFLGALRTRGAAAGLAELGVHLTVARAMLMAATSNHPLLGPPNPKALAVQPVG